MLQDISPLRLDNSYSPDLKPEANDIIFHFENATVLSCGRVSQPFPTLSQLGKVKSSIYLFTIGEHRYFLAFDEKLAPAEGFSYVNVKKLRYAEGAQNVNVMALFTAYHLAGWYRDNRCCGSCGSKTVPDAAERALLCTGCSRIIYPRINPAVIVGVTNGDKLLITRYAKNRNYSYDALVAGFTEIGETFEETVAREVGEEVGLKIKNIRYYRSQPWGYSGSILAGFFCDVDGSDKVCLDESELSSAVWTERSQITGQPDGFSLTNDMMMAFKNGKE